MQNGGKYSEYGRIFIAWGGNRELADLVGKELEERGFSPVIGGIDRSELHPGILVIKTQIPNASHAIILISKQKDNSEAESFRPNLMFEWGFLAGKFPAKYLHVFLIGIERECLPSNLKGFNAIEIMEYNDEQDKKTTDKIAHEIAKRFNKEFDKDLNNLTVKPENALTDWHQWKSQMKQMAESDMTSPLTRSLTILHSIQPAFYHGDINELLDIINMFRNDTHELRRAKQIAIFACEYYKMTDDPFNKPELGPLISICTEFLIDESVNDEALSPWTKIISYDFLGLCYRRMSENSDHEKKRSYLEEACQAFLNARALLEEFKHEEMEIFLWKGYVYRNLGRVYTELGDSNRGKIALNAALKARKDAKRYLNPISGTHISAWLQLKFEIDVVKIDILKADDVPSKDNKILLDEIVSGLTDIEYLPKPYGMVQRTLAQAIEIAQLLNDTENFKKLNALKTRFNVSPHDPMAHL